MNTDCWIIWCDGTRCLLLKLKKKKVLMLQHLHLFNSNLLLMPFLQSAVMLDLMLCEEHNFPLHCGRSCPPAVGIQTSFLSDWVHVTPKLFLMFCTCKVKEGYTILHKRSGFPGQKNVDATHSKMLEICDRPAQVTAATWQQSTSLQPPSLGSSVWLHHML
jgi:hypothetical protein